MAVGQGPPCLRRSEETSVSTGPTCARAASCGPRAERGLRRHRRPREGAKPNRIGAVGGALAGVEELFALKRCWRRSARRTRTCRAGAVSTREGPRLLPLQQHDRGHRECRRGDDRRLEPAQGSAAAQCAHPQALAARRPAGRPRRPQGRSDLRLQPPRHGGRSLRAFVDHKPATRSAGADRRRGPLRAAGRCGADGDGCKGGVALGVVKDGWNGFNVLHTDASMVGALDIGFVPGEGGLDLAAMFPAASMCCSTWARTRSRSRPAPS